MQDMARLSSHGEYAIEDLAAEGITPTAAEIVELSGLGWAVASPEVRSTLSAGVPVQAGNATLYPMSLYAADWYSRIGCRVGIPALALAYAMAHTRPAADLPEGRVSATATILAWAARLRCRKPELMEAVSRVLAQDEEGEQPPEKDPRGISTGELSARLAATCGATPDYWERMCSRQYALDVLFCVMAQSNESGNPLPTDPAIKALRALHWGIERVRERHRKEAANV